MTLVDENELESITRVKKDEVQELEAIAKSYYKTKKEQQIAQIHYLNFQMEWLTRRIWLLKIQEKLNKDT